ncbi:hypothetical protein HHO41_09230 [Bacillus sp. DNRA2]|uniref:hypothetical protein n=1 Tax=Bacillus sp. DNRA2 TaxID=2723053 RepID=UPI00145FCD0C|nr:hypothetical protein [Bacillus sp. DNRA2]NMD70473.1 hypothetical protein [Bacillus sp. DNRA2]
MAFGIKREELMEWKQKVAGGQIAFITHYWLDERFPTSKTVTKVGCRDINRLIEWGNQYGLKPEWIDARNKMFPHFDLIGEKQVEILTKEGLVDYIW